MAEEQENWDKQDLVRHVDAHHHAVLELVDGRAVAGPDLQLAAVSLLRLIEVEELAVLLAELGVADQAHALVGDDVEDVDELMVHRRHLVGKLDEDAHYGSVRLTHSAAPSPALAATSPGKAWCRQICSAGPGAPDERAAASSEARVVFWRVKVDAVLLDRPRRLVHHAEVVDHERDRVAHAADLADDLLGHVMSLLTCSLFRANFYVSGTAGSIVLKVCRPLRTD